MKILNIALTNINSLKGKFFIDFETLLSDQAGVFAITGPTGAGKTSVLDGLCTALYGRTPRLPRTGDMKEIMTHHTGECASEVTFEINQKRYRSWYGRHRAGRKPDGKFQNPAMELTDLSTNTIIASKIKEVPQTVEKLTGLDFERFCRSMLLAQGNFAAFLTAKPDERAVLLEKITGTKIYSIISERTFERKKQEEEKLDVIQQLLAGYSLLTEDEKDEIFRQRAATSKAIKSAEKKRARLIEQKRFLRNLDDCRKKAMAHETEISALAAEKKRVQPELKKLEQCLKAAPLAAGYEKLNYATKRKSSLKNAIDETQKAIPLLEKTLKELKDKGQSQTLLLGRHKHEVDKKLEQITDIQKFLPLIRERRDALKTAASALEEKKKLQKKTGKRFNSTRQDLEKKERVLKKLARELDRTRVTIKTMEAELATEFHGQKSQELEAVARRFERLAFDLVRQGEKADEIKSRGCMVSSLKAECLQNNDLLAACKEKQGLIGTKKKTLTETLKSLEAAREIEIKIKSLDDQRRELVSDTPCPLCGSTDHPYADHLPPAKTTKTQIDSVKKELAALVEAFQEETVTAAKLKSSIQQAKKRIKEEAASITAVEKQFEQLCAATRIEVPPSEDKAIRLALKDARAGLEKAQSSLTRFRSMKQSLEQQSKRHQTLTKEQSKAEIGRSRSESEAGHLGEKLSNLDNELAHGFESVKAQTAALAALGESVQKEMGFLDGEFKDHASLERILNSPQSLETELTACQNRLKQTLKLRETEQMALEKKIAGSKTGLQGKKEALVQLETEFEDVTQSAEVLSDAFIKRLQQAGFKGKKQFLSARLPQDHQKSLETMQQTLSKKQIEMQTLKKNNQEKLDRLLKKPLTLESRESLIKEEKELTREINSLSKKKHQDGFTLEENQKRSLAHKEKLDQEQQQKKELGRWSALNDLIGQKDGGKFRKFAQGLTLEKLTQKANTYLLLFSPRYLLKKERDTDLGIVVIDTFFGDRERPTENLSGGESFLVSLSLALGLSDLSSRRTTIESLFLDEGFGTLDSDTLETALTALDTLNASGKSVGIISHVDALKERIPAKIEVKPVSGGTSTLNLVYC